MQPCPSLTLPASGLDLWGVPGWVRPHPALPPNTEPQAQLRTLTLGHQQLAHSCRQAEFPYSGCQGSYPGYREGRVGGRCGGGQSGEQSHLSSPGPCSFAACASVSLWVNQVWLLTWMEEGPTDLCQGGGIFPSGLLSETRSPRPMGILRGPLQV